TSGRLSARPPGLRPMTPLLVGKCKESELPAPPNALAGARHLVVGQLGLSPGHADSVTATPVPIRDQVDEPSQVRGRFDLWQSPRRRIVCNVEVSNHAPRKPIVALEHAPPWPPTGLEAFGISGHV